MITALNVANNFLERSFEEKVNISPMKLQKLVYILYKEYLKETGYKLFSEKFEAWKYGPVLPNLYNEFKNFKANPITSYALNSNFIRYLIMCGKTIKILVVWNYQSILIVLMVLGRNQLRIKLIY